MLKPLRDFKKSLSDEKVDCEEAGAVKATVLTQRSTQRSGSKAAQLGYPFNLFDIHKPLSTLGCDMKRASDRQEALKNADIETICLPFLPDCPLFIGLWNQVENATFLRQQLLAGNQDFEYAFIDATSVSPSDCLAASCLRLWFTGSSFGPPDLRRLSQSWCYIRHMPLIQAPRYYRRSMCWQQRFEPSMTCETRG